MLSSSLHRRHADLVGWEHGAMEPLSSSDDAMEPPSDGMVVRLGAWRDGAVDVLALISTCTIRIYDRVRMLVDR